MNNRIMFAWIAVLSFFMLGLANLISYHERTKAIVQSTYKARVSEKLWQDAFMARAGFLEQKWRVRFESGWMPNVIFALPENKHYLSSDTLKNDGFHASYDAQTGGFYISPKYVGQDSVNIYIIDHELGHALSDQLSRRNGLGPWPGLNLYSLPSEDIVASRIISEGIADYFGQTSKLYKDLSPDSLPESRNDPRWKDNNFLYEGGHWLVEPIIARYGENGIYYLITHKLKFPDGNLRGAAIKYRDRALYELYKKNP